VRKQKESVLIVGAGASGIAAAISAARRGAEVTIVDRMAQPGRKVLVCGAGRCNLLNDRLDESFYNEAARPLVRSVLGTFGKTAIQGFFSDLGLSMYSEAGRVFPVTDQASSVLRVLSVEMKRLGIAARPSFEAALIETRPEGFAVKSSGGAVIECAKLIVAAGGKSYPKLGSDGSGFELARSIGHSIVEPVPAAVPVVVKDALCHTLQGQRVRAQVQVFIDGRQACSREGDLLFTRYGLSGTAILDVSRDISVALHRDSGRKAELLVDMVPFMQTGALKDELARRFKKDIPAGDILAGIVPDKFDLAFKPLLRRDMIDGLVAGLKARKFAVSGTRGWDEAEFTAGGIATDEIDHGTLESKIQRGVYFCGEVLDVDGERGGYNLAWAWASGFTAGLAH
jgi:predicted Rossmann fold flavoprotein